MYLWVLQVATNAGIRVTQPGVSVPYAADYQYVFNSDWPSLAIAFEAVVTVTGTYGTATVAHNLGFVPFIQVWDYTGGTNNGRVGIAISTLFDKTNINLTNNTASDIVCSIKCYNFDITIAKDYALPKYPIIKTKYDPSTGIKVSKYGKSIGSTDLRDFILHSRSQSPAILSVVTKIDSSYNVTYVNPANYLPWAFAFASFSTGSYQIVSPGPTSAPPQFTFSFPSGNNIGKVVLALSSSAKAASLVILRDPLIVANTKQVTYG